MAHERLGLIKERQVAPDQVIDGFSGIHSQPSEIQIVRVDPLNERDLVDAEIACTNPNTRVRLVWKGALQLTEIERKLVSHPKLAGAIEGWTYS